MNEALVVLLVLLWAIALLPGALRSRRSNAKATVGGFERAMDVLRERPHGRTIMVPADAARLAEPHPLHHLGHGWDDQPADPSAAAAVAAPVRVANTSRRAALLEARRRRFTTMLATTGSLLLLALLTGWAALWVLASGSVVVTAGYTALLRRLKLQRDEASQVVRHLRPAPTERAVVLGLERPPARAQVPVAVGAGGLQVATSPDQPWAPQAGVRIRRWDA
jgi:hypothetical protein